MEKLGWIYLCKGIGAWRTYILEGQSVGNQGTPHQLGFYVCYRHYCSASEVCHPSEVRHLHFMTILKSFYCPVMAYYMYTSLLKETIPFI